MPTAFFPVYNNMYLHLLYSDSWTCSPFIWTLPTFRLGPTFYFIYELYRYVCSTSKLRRSSITFLGLLLCGGLGGHVNSCRSHRDRAPAGDQVQLHGLPGDIGRGHLHMLGQPEVWAEAGHEVSRGDEVHAGLQRLQDQLEASTDLLLGDSGDGADLCRGKEEIRGIEFKVRKFLNSQASSRIVETCLHTWRRSRISSRVEKCHSSRAAVTSNNKRWFWPLKVLGTPSCLQAM